MLIPSSACLSAHHSVTPSPHSPPLPQPFVCFPELGVSHGLSEWGKIKEEEKQWLLLPSNLYSGGDRGAGQEQADIHKINMTT